MRMWFFSVYFWHVYLGVGALIPSALWVRKMCYLIFPFGVELGVFFFFFFMCFLYFFFFLFCFVFRVPHYSVVVMSRWIIIGFGDTKACCVTLICCSLHRVNICLCSWYADVVNCDPQVKVCLSSMSWAATEVRALCGWGSIRSIYSLVMGLLLRGQCRSPWDVTLVFRW